jgi:NADP-dependent 3-hydroxy acid dehydrogenase YdfG
MDINQQFLLTNLYDVKGRVALVTGGGSGIGLMVSQETLASELWGAD